MMLHKLIKVGLNYAETCCLGIDFGIIYLCGNVYSNMKKFSHGGQVHV